ncbi:MAG TPA: hypothetical protein PK843_12975 [bacterium]|mgnify:CR=1 FL=1|nr:hypothetical protein [bacterium]HPN35423.1 hypothetical protein [bacterium]
MRKSVVLLLLLMFTVTLPLFGRDPLIYFSIVFRKQITVVGQDIQVFGLYYGAKDAQTWERCGWKNNSIFGVAVDTRTDGQNIFLAAGNGVLRSLDAGKTWKIVTDWTITEVTKVYLDPLRPKTVYATSSSFVWKSDDYGDSWRKISQGLKPTSQTYCNGLALLPSDTRVLFLATADGIMKSVDGGENWQPCGLLGREVHEIQIAPYDETVLAAATDDAGVYVSRDGGKVWRQRAMGMRGRTIYTLVFDPVEKGVLYCGGYLCGINKSTDYGEKWTHLDNEISDRTVRSLAIYPTDNRLIFAGLLNYGLWRSADSGSHFTCAAEPDGRVYCMGIF